MGILDWFFNSATFTAIVVGAIVVARPWYIAAVDGVIKSSVEKEIAAYQSKLRQDEALVAARLAHQDEQLRALQAGALSNLAQHHQELQKRKLIAVERMWEAVIYYNQFMGAIGSLQVMNVGALIERTSSSGSDSTKIQKFGELMWDGSNFATFNKASATHDVERLFVAEETWALFSTYRQIFAYAYATVAVIRIGMKDIFQPPDQLIELVKAALPHQSEYLGQYGINGVYAIVGQLRDKILTNLRADIEGIGASRENLTKAQGIISAAQQMNIDPAISMAMPETIRVKIPAPSAEDTFTSDFSIPPHLG